MASDLAGPDRDLIERLAARVVELHMEIPAVLALETGKPLSLLASQAMLFFEPIVQAIFSVTEYRRLALLVEKRETLEALTAAIERRAEATRAAARAGGPPRRGAGGSAPRDR